MLGAMRELSRKKMEGYVATMFFQLKGYFMHTYSGIKLVSLTHTENHVQTLSNLKFYPQACTRFCSLSSVSV